jgi:hypothetical protein
MRLFVYPPRTHTHFFFLIILLDTRQSQQRYQNAFTPQLLRGVFWVLGFFGDSKNVQHMFFTIFSTEMMHDALKNISFILLR